MSLRLIQFSKASRKGGVVQLEPSGSGVGTTTGILAENGDNLVSEAGNFLIQE